MVKMIKISRLFIFGLVGLFLFWMFAFNLETWTWTVINTLEKTIKQSPLNAAITHAQPKEIISESLQELCKEQEKMVIFFQLPRTGGGAMMKHLFKAPDVVIDDGYNRLGMQPLPGDYASRADEICATKCVVKAFMSPPDVEALREACAKQGRRVEIFTTLRHPLERLYSFFECILSSTWWQPYVPPEFLAQAKTDRTAFFEPDSIKLHDNWFQTFINNSMIWQLGHQRHASERHNFDLEKNCNPGEELYDCLHRRSLEFLATMDYVGSYEDLKGTFAYIAEHIFFGVRGTWPFHIKFMLGATLGFPYNGVLKHGNHLSPEERELMLGWIERDVRLWTDAMLKLGLPMPYPDYSSLFLSLNFPLYIASVLCVAGIVFHLVAFLLVLLTLPIRLLWICVRSRRSSLDNNKILLQWRKTECGYWWAISRNTIVLVSVYMAASSCLGL